MRYKNFRFTKFRLAGALFALALMAQAAVPLLIPRTSAAPLTNVYVRLNRLATAQDTKWELDFKPATAGATSLSVDFSSAWTTNSGTVSSTQAIGACADSSDTTPTGGSASGSGSVVTVSSITALSNSTQYCLAFTTANSVHTPTAGAYTFTVTVGSDSSTVATTIVGAGADQVTVNATVNPAFSMSLSATSDTLPTLDVATVKTSSSAVQATINTNAANGWNLWGTDSNQGLKSTNAGGYTIPSVTTCTGGVSGNSTLTAGTEGYNLGASVNTQGSGSGGTASIATVFVGGSLGKGGGLCSAGYQVVATSTGTANAAKIDMKNSAAISGVTKPATDYTDLETFVGAGIF